jgi:hypothetical protein
MCGLDMPALRFVKQTTAIPPQAEFQWCKALQIPLQHAIFTPR